MTAPSVVVELFLGGSWVPITSKVRISDGITVKRGRNNEASDPDPGMLIFTVDNSDGRFTIGKTTGVYGANFVLWVQCRYTVNSTVHFLGYVQSAPVSWNRQTRALSDVMITCIDVVGMMAMSPTVRPWSTALIAALTPTYWWKMNGIAINTSAAETNGGPSLVGSVLDPGTDLANPAALADVLAFGTDGPASLESDGMAQFTFTNTGGEAALTCTVGTLPSSFTVLFMVNQAGGVGDLLVQLFDPAGDQLNIIVDADSLSVSESDLTPATVYVPGGTAYAPTFKDTPCLVAVTFTPTTIGYVGGATAARPPLHTDYSNGTLQVSGRRGVVQVANLAIIPGVMSASTFTTLKSCLLADGAGLVVDWLNRAASEAGYASSVTATFNRTMQRPDLKGSNPADVGNTLANSCGSMFVADRTGAPRWIDFTYCPTRVDLDYGDFSNRDSWDADASLWYTNVKVDGTTRYTGSGFPLKDKTIDGLLPDANLTHYITWLANSASIWRGPRVAGIEVNLWPMDSTRTAKYLALNLGSRIFPLNVPAQLPTPMVCTVEGYQMTINDKAWTIAYNTAPDPRFVLGDSVAGVLASNYRLAPLS